MSTTPMKRGRSAESTLRWVLGGVVVGTMVGLAYATSGFNPARGGPLDLGTALILTACPLLGAVLGYVIAQAGGGPE